LAAQRSASPVAAEPEVEEEVVEATPDPGYSGWSKTELKAEAEAQGLPVSGTKAELIERLESA